MKKRRKEGPAPKRKRTPGRRLTIGSEGPRALRVAWGPRGLGPPPPKKDTRPRPLAMGDPVRLLS